MIYLFLVGQLPVALGAPACHISPNPYPAPASAPPRAGIAPSVHQPCPAPVGCATVLSMTDEAAIYPALTEIFQEVFNRDDIALNAGMTAKDLAGWDSFRQIEIIVCVEERYGIKLNTKEIDALRCVGDLVSVIARKT